MKAQFFGSWKDVRDGEVETGISENSPITGANRPFPVLLFSPGLGVPALAYSIQLAELASQGYVIFALNHPYDTALVRLPEGRSITLADRNAPKGPPNAALFRLDAERESVWTKDTQFALQMIRSLNSQDELFKRSLDLSNIGVFGHSMGGRVAAQACQVLVEVRACLNQDGGLFGVDFRSGEVVPFVTERTSTNGSFLNIDVPIHLSPGDVDAEGEKGFNAWQAKKSKVLQDFLVQNAKPTYSVVSRQSGLAHGLLPHHYGVAVHAARSDPAEPLTGVAAVAACGARPRDGTR